jgi:hypothetical protein
VSDPGQCLHVVLRAYAHITHRIRHRHDTDIGPFLHRDEHLADAQRQLHDRTHPTQSSAGHKPHEVTTDRTQPVAVSSSPLR